MKSEKRRERMLALFGNDPELLKAFEETKPPPPLSDSQRVQQSDSILEAEAVLDFLWHPEKYKEKLCKQCGQLFATNRPKSVSLCSVECMKSALQEVGILWDPLKSLESRYQKMRRLPDMIVPPVALEHLRSLLFPDGASPEPLSEEEEHTQAS